MGVDNPHNVKGSHLGGNRKHLQEIDARLRKSRSRGEEERRSLMEGEVNSDEGH